MAHAAKYRDTFDAVDGFTYRVSLTKDGATLAGGLDFAGTDHTSVEWEPSAATDDELAPLIPSEATVSIFDPAGTIDGEIFAAAEGDFRLVIERKVIGEADGTYVEYWRGVVLNDQTEQTLDQYGNVTTIRATDGLGLLEGRKYEDVVEQGGVFLPRIPPVEIVQYILNDIGLALPLYVAMEWRNYQATGPQMGATDQAMALDTMARNLWAPAEEGESYTAHFALTEILKTFGLQLYQYGGAWHAVQRELLETGAYTRHVYPATYPTDPATSEAFDSTATLPADLYPYRLAGGRRTKLPPYLASTFVHEHGVLQALDNTGFEGEFTAGVPASWLVDGVIETGLSLAASEGAKAVYIGSTANTGDPGDIAAAFSDSSGSLYQTGRTILGGNGSLFRFEVDIFSDDDDASLSSFIHERYAFVEVKIGAYWLAEDGSWSAVQAILATEAAFRKWTTISVTSTTEIPDTGALFVALYEPVEAHGGAEASDAVVAFDNIRYAVLQGGEAESTSTASTATATASTAKLVRPAEVLTLADGPDYESRGALWDQNDEATDDWGRGVQASASGVTLHRLLAESVVNLRRSPRDVHQATYMFGPAFAPIEIVNTFEVGSLRYGLVRLIRNLPEATGALEAAEVTRSTDSVTYSSAVQRDTTFAGGGTVGGGTVGGETVYAASLTALVRKATAGTIAALVPVYVTGYNVAGGYYTVEAADADDAAKRPALFVSASAVTDSTTVRAVAKGLFERIDTSGYSAGDLLYLSASGGLTATKPTATVDRAQVVAVVLYSDATAGALYLYGAGYDTLLDGGVIDGALKLTRSAGTETHFEYDASGNITIGRVGASLVNVRRTAAGVVEVRLNTAVLVEVSTAGVVTVKNAAGTGHLLQIETQADKLGEFGAVPVVQPAHADQAAPAAITQQALTDSSGGTPGTTIAAMTNTAVLTDASGGTADDALEAVGATNSGDVSGAINNNFAEIADELAKQRTLNALLINAVASLAARANEARTDETNGRVLPAAIRTALVNTGRIKGSA